MYVYVSLLLLLPPSLPLSLFFPSLPPSFPPSLPLPLTERNEKEELQSQLSDVQEECGLLGMELEEIRMKVERLTEECLERSDQANEWYKALQVQCVGIHLGREWREPLP